MKVGTAKKMNKVTHVHKTSLEESLKMVVFILKSPNYQLRESC